VGAAIVMALWVFGVRAAVLVALWVFRVRATVVVALWVISTIAAVGDTATCDAGSRLLLACWHGLDCAT
jgi:hypothetical protein